MAAVAYLLNRILEHAPASRDVHTHYGVWCYWCFSYCGQLLDTEAALFNLCDLNPTSRVASVAQLVEQLP